MSCVGGELSHRDFSLLQPRAPKGEQVPAYLSRGEGVCKGGGGGAPFLYLPSHAHGQCLLRVLGWLIVHLMVDLGVGDAGGSILLFTQGLSSNLHRAGQAGRRTGVRDSHLTYLGRGLHYLHHPHPLSCCILATCSVTASTHHRGKRKSEGSGSRNLETQGSYHS